MNDHIARLIKLSENLKAKTNIVTADDRSYKDVEILIDNIEIDILFTRVSDNYYATGIESPGLPRNIYDDDFNEEEVDQRSDEILNNVRDILMKKIYFYKSKSLFTRNTGYIYLSVEGKKVKINQKGNYFKLDDKV